MNSITLRNSLQLLEEGIMGCDRLRNHVIGHLILGYVNLPQE